MTQTTSLLPPSKQQRPSFLRKSLVFLIGIVVLLLAAGAIWFAVTHYVTQPEIGQGADADLVARLDRAERRIAALETQIEQIQVHSAEPAASTSAAPSADPQRLQNDIAALTATIAVLQDQLHSTDKTARQAQLLMQTQLAEALDFMQLRATALDGHAFTAELDALRKAGGDDTEIKAALDALSPYAVGAATPASLLAQLIAIEPAARQATDRGAADSIGARIKAQLEGLITIRPVHGGMSGDFVALENALTHEDTAAALKAFADLPQPAQNTLAAWRNAAAARVAVETGLKLITVRILALLGQEPVTPPLAPGNVP